jgi:hypothetical protein
MKVEGPEIVKEKLALFSIHTRKEQRNILSFYDKIVILGVAGSSKLRLGRTVGCKR